jgi:hypothetical protein
MTGDQDPGAAAGRSPADETKITVDARHAIGVAVGDGVTQINNYYGAVLTWSDGVAASALTDSQGHFDSPYRGLSAFEARDAAFFFGRDPAGDELLDLISQRMDSDGLVVVSGISGVGKSSLVRAGVLPRWTGEGLRAVPGSQAWPCLMFTPTGDPLGELARWIGTLAGLPAPAVRRELAASPEAFALLARQVTAAVMAGSGRSAGERPRATAEPRLLLVIDQFEQLFTQCPDEGQRRAFIAALRAATTSDPGSGRPAAALAVAVVRNDFEARCADYPELAAAVQERYLLTPMSERQLRLAITEPARKAGSSVEQALVDELLEKVVRGGTMLASGSLDGTVWRWNPVTGKTIGRPLNSHTESVYSVAFSPDGKILAAGTDDSAIQLWNAATGKAIDGPLISHAGPVISVAFSPDGRTLAAASDDGTVWLWNVATHQPTGTPITGSAGPVNSVAFSPDGKTLAVGDNAGTVQLWDVSYLIDPQQSLCADAGAYFTPSGWATYVPAGPAYQNICR